MKKLKSFEKQIICIICAFVLCFCSVAPVFAINELSGPQTIAEEKEEKEALDEKESDEKSDKEKKSNSRPVLGEGETGVLIDAVSGRILFEKNGAEKMYPASTTKIMTALLAIEAVERGEISMDTQIEVTKEMIDGLDPDGTNIALKEGEIMSLERLLHGLMIPSGNDAACVIATHIGGSVASFVDMMNGRAEELGATGTHFMNPHGLHDDEHYTTAEDMAKIAHAAMKYDRFRNIVDIVHVKIPPTNKTETERYYISTNGLLSYMRYTDYFFKGSTGIKTGYTSKAGNCLVSGAMRNGVEFIGVIFGGKTSADSHLDSIEMLKWGFNNYVSIVALQKDAMPGEIRVKQGRGADTLTMSVPEAVSATVPEGTKREELEIRLNIPDAIYAPVHAGDEIGTVSVMLNGEELSCGVLLANKTIERSFFWPVMALGEWLWSKPLVRVVSYVAIATAVTLVLAFVYGLIVNIKRANQHRKRRIR